MHCPHSLFVSQLNRFRPTRDRPRTSRDNLVRCVLHPSAHVVQWVYIERISVLRPYLRSVSHWLAPIAAFERLEPPLRARL